MVKTPPVNFSYMDWFDAKFMPKKFEGFLLNGRIGAHDLGHGEKFLSKTFNDRFLVPVIGLKTTWTLLDIESLISSGSLTNFNYPSLFLLGEKDVVTPMAETHKIFKKIKFKDLTVQ